MKLGVLLVLVVGVALLILALLQHFNNLITADHVAIAFGVVGLIVLTLGAFLTLTNNN
ncbi:MAG: hypothetical protein IVW57_07695 [Ktedonobacterales bacterium]|nr:hypothetical protein [Ktedonobacterales bacterium]